MGRDRLPGFARSETYLYDALASEPAAEPLAGSGASGLTGAGGMHGPVRPAPAEALRGPVEGRNAPRLPDYLVDTYSWAYLRPASVSLLDNPVVVSTILWGQSRRLQRAAFAELRPGLRVLQPACVYGDFSPRLAATLGPSGWLDVTDVAPIQVENCRRKLKGYANAATWLCDAADHGAVSYDAVCCFFLLHEIPDSYKRLVVDALLRAVRPGGKAIFVDYHRPHWAHPLRAAMSVVLDTLEPYAKGLWWQDIAGFASDGEGFAWSKRTYFGGLYQRIVAQRS